MLTIHRAAHCYTGRSWAFGAILLLISGCGLGLDNAARYERAQSAYERHDYRAAIVDAKTILQQEPQNRSARILLGRAALRLPDLATAEKELRRAIDLGADIGTIAVDLGQALAGLRKYDQLLEEIRPELAQSEVDRLAILQLRGDALLALGKPDVARTVYAEILMANPDHLLAKLGVAAAYVAERNFAEARLILDEILAASPQEIQAWLASGSLFGSAGNFEEAIAAYTQALNLAKAQSTKMSQLAALNGLAEVQLASGNIAMARDTLNQLQALAPNMPSSQYLEARIAYLDEDYDGAHGELQQLLSVTPDFLPAQFLMGAVQLRRGNLGQAEMHLTAYLAGQPADVAARKLLAEISLRQNRADKAAEILDPVLHGADADMAALNLAVRLSLQAGNYTDAVRYLRQSLEIDPDNEEILLDLATAHLVAGDVGQAEELLTAMPDDVPESSTYRRDLLGVMALLRRGDTATALRRAEAMAELRPTDARIRNLIGGITLSIDQLDIARNHFLAARAIDPSDLGSYLNVAAIDLRRGDLDSARRQYLLALEQQPASVDVMIALAGVEARAKNRDEAVTWLERARMADTSALTPRLLLAQYYISERSFESAAQAAKEALELDAGNAEAHNLLGLAYQGQGDQLAALTSFDQATRSDPQPREYRLNQARAQIELGNFEAAERALLPDGRIDLDDVQTSSMIALLRYRQGDDATAMKIAKDLQQRHPENATPYALEAELLAAENRFVEAMRQFDKALSRSPDNRKLVLRAYRSGLLGKTENPGRPLVDYLRAHPADTEIRLLLAQDQQSRGEAAAAIQEYERVLAASPQSFVALNNLGWLYFQVGDPRAEATARRAFELAPENGSVADTLGWILVQNGKLDEGIPVLEKAVALSGGEVVFRYHLASGLVAANRKAEARRLLEEALASAEEFSGRADAEQLLSTL